MLGDFGKEVQGVENLEIPIHSCTEIAAGRFRKLPATVMFRLIHHMPGRGYLQYPVFFQSLKENKYILRFPQNIAVEAEVNPEPFRNGEDELPMRDFRKEFLADMH